MNYWWVRIYDYDYERELEMDKENYFIKSKGTLLDEFYLKGENLSREDAKALVREKSGNTNLKFAKPRKKKDGVYAVFLASEKHWYNRFYLHIESKCSYCGKKISGKEADIPSSTYDYTNNSEYDPPHYFCSHEHRKEFHSYGKYEGEFQEKTVKSKNILGYIYCIYNRKEDKYYIGKTIYLPFFRWQEHMNSGKGDIEDLIFFTITSVSRNSKIEKKGSNKQGALNRAEDWWINKYIEDYGRDRVMNIKINSKNEPYSYNNTILTKQDMNDSVMLINK